MDDKWSFLTVDELHLRSVGAAELHRAAVLTHQVPLDCGRTLPLMRSIDDPWAAAVIRCWQGDAPIAEDLDRLHRALGEFAKLWLPRRTYRRRLGVADTEEPGYYRLAVTEAIARPTERSTQHPRRRRLRRLR